MKTICFYFQIHQPFRLKRYRFFDIGNDHYYYDDFQNEEIIHRIAEQCYLPANRTILEMIKTSGGKFKVAFSISGVALEQMEIYTPEVIDSFKELAATGNVEFLSETYAHSLSSLGDPEEFKHQVKKQEDKIKTLFGVKPKVFRNTELIYSDDISAMVSEMGYKGMLTEGAKHILGWKSPNYMYSSCVAPKLSLLLKNDRFSEDLSNRFSQYWAEIQTHAAENVAVSLMHFTVGFDQTVFVQMEGISIFHGEFTTTHHTKARANFITEFGLDLIQVQWQLFVAVYFVTNQCSNDFFMGRA
jgi:alpha-amylase